jgi:hypothetical protein
MDPTDHALPGEQRPWVKRLEKSLLVVLTIAVCLIGALGLVAIGVIVVFVFAMNNFGSNK